MPEWNVTHRDAQEIRQDITHGAMREAKQRKVKDMEKRPKRFSIERMIDETGRNSDLYGPINIGKSYETEGNTPTA